MDKTLKELVDLHITHVRPRLKVDQRIEPEFVADYIHTARLEVIKDVYRSKTLMDGFYQRVRVIITRDDTTIRFTLSNGQYVEYSNDDAFFILPIPSVMSALNASALKYIGGVNFSNPYDRVTLNEFMLSDVDYFTKDRAKVTLDIDKIYAKNIPASERIIEAMGIFRNPTEVPDFTWNVSYPMPMDFLEKLQYIVRSKLYEHFSIPTDLINDDIDQTTFRQTAKKQDDES